MNLLPKIARGDLRALEMLYERNKTRVYRLVLSMTGDSYLAEDITQETFLRVQERAKTYRSDISETAWVVTIARNLTYDILRRFSREIVNEKAIFPDTYVMTDTDDHSRLMFLDLIKDLSQQEKEVICLRILASLSWYEIGQITGQSADTSRKRYTRSLKKLRSRMQSERKS